MHGESYHRICQLCSHYLDPVRGGILGKEMMGLDKTIEMFAVMCLHKRQLVEGGPSEEFN